MGACCGNGSGSVDTRKLSPQAKQNHLAIQRDLDETHKSDSTIKKLLLLGAGSSGKSTIFRHLTLVLTNELDNGHVEETQHTIRKNCVIGMMKLLKTGKIGKYDQKI